MPVTGLFYFLMPIDTAAQPAGTEGTAYIGIESVVKFGDTQLSDPHSSGFSQAQNENIGAFSRYYHGTHSLCRSINSIFWPREAFSLF